MQPSNVFPGFYPAGFFVSGFKSTSFRVVPILLTETLCLSRLLPERIDLAFLEFSGSVIIGILQVNIYIKTTGIGKR